MRFFKALLFIVLLCGCWFIFTTQSYAQTGLEVKPAILDVPIIGNEVERTVTLTNYFDKPIAVEVFVRALQPQDQIVDTNKYFDARSIIIPESTSLLLGAGESRQFTVKFLKSELPFGSGSYASIIFRVVGLQSEGSNNVAVNTELGVQVLLTSNGEPNESMKIDISAPRLLVFGSLPVVEGSIENNGTIHLAPILSYEIINRKGEVLTSFNQTEALLLPGTKRDIRYEPPKNLPPGAYAFRIRASYGIRQLAEEAVTNRMLLLPSLLNLLLGGSTLAVALFLITRRKNHSK